MWPEHTFALVASVAVVYAVSMNTVVSSAQGSGRSSQDETAPFPLEFEVVARKARQSQDETSPFLLEFMVILPDGESAFVRTARPPRSRRAQRSPRGLPLLKWHGVDASRELREYAARIAAGEKLPPYCGPILANGESPRARPATDSGVSSGALSAVPVDDSKAFVKLGLALMVMTALVVASLMLGDDAQLRSVGQSISGWLTGRDDVRSLPVIKAGSERSPER